MSRSLVVFVHGYGADGDDLLGLADALSPRLPDTAFVAPDAPEPIEGFAQGLRWFGIPRFDGSIGGGNRSRGPMASPVPASAG